MDLITRAYATQKTIDKWQKIEFKWGEADCGQLVGSHLEELGITTPLKNIRPYSTETGARRSMKLAGANTMEDFCDNLGLKRIAPAMAVAGDIVGLPGGSEGNEWTALGVHLGGGKVLAFAAEADAPAYCEWGTDTVCTLAWRVA